MKKRNNPFHRPPENENSGPLSLCFGAPEKPKPAGRFVLFFFGIQCHDSGKLYRILETEPYEISTVQQQVTSGSCSPARPELQKYNFVSIYAPVRTLNHANITPEFFKNACRSAEKQ